MAEATIIRVRRGINGYPYSACDKDGYFVQNFRKLSDVRKRWLVEIRWGQVRLVRELDKQPDMSKIEATKTMLEKILQSYKKEQNRRRKKICMK